MPDTFEDGMPKVDDEGREIVRIISEAPSGWRYGYKDTLILGYKEYKGKVEAPAPAAAAEQDKQTDNGWPS